MQRTKAVHEGGSHVLKANVAALLLRKDGWIFLPLPLLLLPLLRKRFLLLPLLLLLRVRRLPLLLPPPGGLLSWPPRVQHIPQDSF
jgi:hypothetical protein